MGDDLGVFGLVAKSDVYRVVVVLVCMALVWGCIGSARADGGDGGDMPVRQFEPVWRVVCAEALYVRGSPRVGAMIVGHLHKGEVVLVHEWWMGWGMVGQARWVAGWWLCEE